MKKILIALSVMLVFLVFSGISYAQALGSQYEIKEYDPVTVTLDSTTQDTVIISWLLSGRGAVRWGNSYGNISMWAKITSTGTEVDSQRIWYKELMADGGYSDLDSTFIKSSYALSGWTDGKRKHWQLYPAPTAKGLIIFFEQTANDSTGDDPTTLEVIIAEQ